MLGEKWAKAIRASFSHEVRASTEDRAKIGAFLSQHGVRKRDYILRRGERRAVGRPRSITLPGLGTFDAVQVRVVPNIYRFKKAEDAVLLRLALDETGHLA